MEGLVKRTKREEEEVRNLMAKVELPDFDRIEAEKWLAKCIMNLRIMKHFLKRQMH